MCFAGAALVEAGRIADIRLAFGSVAPTVVRALDTESMMRCAALDQRALDRAGVALLAELIPIDDVRSTADYRRTVAARVLHRLVREAGGW